MILVKIVAIIAIVQLLVVAIVRRWEKKGKRR